MMLLGFGTWAASNSLFNGENTNEVLFGAGCGCWLLTLSCLVDGGHRAIKYSRLAGVKKDIYSEGRIFERHPACGCVIASKSVAL